jgi:hypothetical protein
MVHNTGHYWGSGLRLCLGILKHMTFRKLFLSSGEGFGDIYFVGSVGKGYRKRFSEMLCCLE